MAVLVDSDIRVVAIINSRASTATMAVLAAAAMEEAATTAVAGVATMVDSIRSAQHMMLDEGIQAVQSKSKMGCAKVISSH